MILSGILLNLLIGMGTLTGLWLVYLWKRNTAIVDLGWAMGLTLMGLVHHLGSGTLSLGRGLIACLVLLWGLRLGGYLFWTRLRLGKKDARYDSLKRPSCVPEVWFILIHYLIQACFQAAVGFVFIFTAQTAMWNSLWIWIGLTVWCAGYAGTITADAQLNRFRSESDNRGKVCSAGLWQYSRHPNYFFEILLWTGFALIGMSAPWGWLGLMSPLTLLSTMTLITGPISERQSLKSKPVAYRHYQQTTAMIIPWFNRRPSKTL
jgi:steroid 5-alpha reductase family enzyme